MTDSTGVTAFSYSPLSELVSETYGNISKSYSYDKNSARTAFTLSKGGTALLSNTYVNTNTGMLKSMQSGTDTVSYNYDLNKNMTSEVINNALTHSVTYNKHNSVKTAENKFGNAVHSSYSYEVLKNGNVSSVSETLAGASRQRAFDYDGIGRLKKETDGTDEISYTYDASGNRLTFDKTALPQRSYGYLPGNISWYSTSNNAFAEYTHDNNGNILSKTGNRVTDYTMTYDGFNRLISSAAGENPVSLSYEYNGDGLRTAKTAKGTRTDFIWDGDRLVCEISGESVTVYKYGNRLFGFEKDGVKKYYNFNGHGDVTGITDSAYTLIKSYEYDAFGVEKNPDPADTNPFRYCAEYYDAETGYIYLRARYYDVRDGRFISEDPAKDGLNWYVYCGNNPVNFVDPTGHIKEGDERLNNSIQVILNGPNKDGKGGLSRAWLLAKRGDRITIAQMADRIRGFNTQNINRHMILVNISAAEGAGHTATLLLNESEQGILFSFYPEQKKPLDNGQMRIAFLDYGQWNELLYDKKDATLICSNGEVKLESFDDNLYIGVSKSSGEQGLNEIAYQYTHPGKYNLATHNCDHLTSIVAAAAGLFYDKRILPNDSFIYTKMYYTNYEVWKLNQAIRN